MAFGLLPPNSITDGLSFSQRLPLRYSKSSDHLPNHTCRKMLFFALGITLTAYVGLCLFFLATQRTFIYHPCHDHNTTVTRITLPNKKIPIQAAYHPHDGPRSLIYFGGNAEDVSRTLPEIAATFPDFSIFMLYYRGYSGSPGKPTEAGLREDAAALFKFVRRRYADVTLIGRSLGSGLAVGLAAEHAPQQLILITPFDSVLAIASQFAPFLPMRLLLRDRWDSVRAAPKVTCPTLILAASNDELIPMAHTDRLLRAFPDGVARASIIANTDHNSISAASSFWNTLRNFIVDESAQVR